MTAPAQKSNTVEFDSSGVGEWTDEERPGG